MKVITKIKIYEINRKETPSIDGPELSIESYWNNNRIVTIQMPSGETFSIFSEQLIKAIQNAANTT